jgi:AraC-like DNA-binding protein
MARTGQWVFAPFGLAGFKEEPLQSSFKGDVGRKNEAMVSMDLTEVRQRGAGVPAGIRVPTINESPASGTYCDQMTKHFRVGKVTSLVIGRSRLRVAMTRLMSAVGLPSRTAPIACDKAFVVAVHLTGEAPQGCEIWLGDRYFRVMEWPIGGIGIYDLELNLSLRNRGPVDWVHYYIPRSAVETLADDLEIQSVRTLQCSFGAADMVLHRMTEMILPALDGSARFSELFLDHYFLLLCTHVMKTYGSSAPVKAYRGGLAPWQKRRVMELLSEHLDGSVRLATLAEECGLSVSHFARSFRRTFGRSAHQYLILQRIEKAKALLSGSMCALSEAALQAGFSDQAAFSRTFKAVVGTSPGQWRREVSYRRSRAPNRRTTVGPELLMQTRSGS